MFAEDDGLSSAGLSTHISSYSNSRRASVRSRIENVKNKIPPVVRLKDSIHGKESNARDVEVFALRKQLEMNQVIIEEKTKIIDTLSLALADTSEGSTDGSVVKSIVDIKDELLRFKSRQLFETTNRLREVRSMQK